MKMNKKVACDLLDLDENYNDNDLKRQYKLMALKFHPDKNTDKDTTSDFQNIQLAYVFLSELNNRPRNDEERTFFANLENYDEILKCFVNFLIKNKFSLKLLLELDIEILELMVNLLSSYIENQNWILYKEHIIKIKTEVERIVVERKASIDTVCLEPTIDDLFEQKIFCLKRDENIYLVPLWHNEMTFKDVSNNTFIVRCEPNLDDHLDIDEYNNVIIHLKYEIANLLDNENIHFNIGKKEFKIHVDEIMIKREQTFMFPHLGIPRINDKDFKKNIEIGDVVVRLTLV